MKSRSIPLLWRWSVRDMRERWLQVVGISLIIALGVAIFSGLGSAAEWRTASLDESYAMLNMYDLKLEFSQGSYLGAEQLMQTVRSIPHADWIEDVEVRLSFPTIVDASAPGERVLISGRVIGVDVSGGGPDVNRLHVTSGRGLGARDVGAPVCVVEHNFANYYELEPGDRPVRLGGGYTLHPVGSGISAEHFMVLDEEAGFLGVYAQDRYAVLFIPLDTAQEIAELPGMANELLVTVPEGLLEAELDQLKAELGAEMTHAFPQIDLELEKGSENRVYQLMYEDIDGAQQMYDTFAFILLLGAAFGAFILVGRIVDAQRREIGIHMALGVPPMRIARRYLLIGLQIAVLGMVLGIILAVLIKQPMARYIGEALPMPYFESPIQPAVFVRGALTGIVIPILAVVYPIWRAVRVTPIDAIQTGYLVSKGGGLVRLLARLRLPGSSFTQFPLRNLSRGLRRTMMTVLGLSMAIIVMFVLIGIADSTLGTLEAGGREATQDSPERTVVLFDDFYALSSPPISEVVSDARMIQALPVVVLSGQLVGDETFDVIVQLMDLDNDLWTPTVVRGDTRSEAPSVLITEKAARDLGVDVGDRVTLRHLYRESRYVWHFTETSVQVMGLHPDVLRTAVYMDLQDAVVMNLAGFANSLHLDPAPGVEVEDLRQALSRLEGVTRVQRASAASDAVRELFAEGFAVLGVVQYGALLIAFLIAFNTTRSNVDERRRDLATMFAFGTPVRTVIRMAMVENLIIGLLGTAVGIGLSWLMLSSVLLERTEAMQPDMDVIISVAPATLGWAVLIGVVAVTLTPLFLARRLTKMDIPSTLRVVE